MHTARTRPIAVDVAAGLPLPDALVTLDSAARLALVEQFGIHRLCEHYANPRSLAAGRSALLDAVVHATTQFTRRSLLEVVALADPRRETALESHSFGQFILAGLPLPETQSGSLPRVAMSTPTCSGETRWHRRGPRADQGRLTGRAASRGASPQNLEQLGYRVMRWEL